MYAESLPERTPIDLAFVFCHPSRSSGGPLRDLLAAVFADRFRAQYNKAPDALRFADESEASFMFDLVCRYQPRPIVAVSANFLVVPAHIGPTNGGVPMGTVLRDPIERICSEFLSHQRDVRGNPNASPVQKKTARSLQEFADKFVRGNFYARFFSQTELWEPLNENSMQTAIKNLGRFSIAARPDRNGLREAAETLVELLPSPSRDAAAAWCAANQARLDLPEATLGGEMARSLPASVRSRLQLENKMDMEILEGLV